MENKIKWSLPYKLLVLIVIGSILLMSSMYLENFSTKFIPIQFGNYHKTECINEDDCQFECLSAVVAQIKLCILGGFTESSDQFEPTVNLCSKFFLNNIPPFHILQNADESKYVWLPVEGNSNSFRCTVVSWGVGNDIKAEKGLRSLFPQCKFYGADPIYESGKVYKEIGDYYQIAVGANNGNQTASVLENGFYSESIVQYIGMEQFFVLTKLDFVDYLIMDNEGAEYQIIPLMERTKFKTTICQFNAELHLPLGYYNVNETEFVAIFRSFLINSDFLPVMIVHAGHIRTVWLNIAERKCIEKFLPNYCM